MAGTRRWKALKHEMEIEELATLAKDVKFLLSA